MNRLLPAVGLISALAVRPVRAQVTVEVLGGNSFSAPTRLTVLQAGQPPIRLTARYSTRPLEDTWYYAVRVGFWKNHSGWLFDFIHHKLYLDNPPPEVRFFEITYGFNILTIGRGWERGPFVFSAGLGPVITHPSSSVRGRKYVARGGVLHLGYRLSGASAVGGVGWRLHLGEAAYLAVDGRISASYAQVPVAGGEAHVPNAALHLHGGVGVRF